MDRTWQSPQLASQVSRLTPTGLLCMGMDERTGLWCEGGNAADLIRMSQRKLQATRAQFTTERQPVFAASSGIFENQL